MSSSLDMASGKLSPEVVLGVGYSDSAVAAISVIAADGENPFAYKGVDIAIAQIKDLDVSDMSDDSLTPVVFCQDSEFYDRGLLSGYVSALRVLATAREHEYGVYPYNPEVHTVYKGCAGVILGQLLDLQDKTSVSLAMPGVLDKVNDLKEIHPEVMPHDAQYTSAFYVCKFGGVNTWLIEEAQQNDARRSNQLVNNPPTYDPIQVEPI
jgi:hypothetical protein